MRDDVVAAFLLALLHASAAVEAQPLAAPFIPDVDYPTLPERAAAAAGFAPRGWQVESSARGDLDGDRSPDLAFILRAHDPANIVVFDGIVGEVELDTNPRMLGIAFSDPGGDYRLALQDRVFIPRPTEFGNEWLYSIEIRRRTLRVSFEPIRGRIDFTFRWLAGGFRLIGYDYSGVAGGCISALSINYLTRRTKTYLAYVSGDTEQVRWQRWRGGPGPTFGQIGNGLWFNPDGALDRLPGDCRAAGLVPETPDG